MNRINTQERREYGNLLDTDTDLEHGTVYDTEDAVNKLTKSLLLCLQKINKMMKFLMKKMIMMLLKRQKQNWNKILLLILSRNKIMFMIL